MNVARESSVEQDSDRYNHRREKSSKKHKHHDREKGDHGGEKHRHHKKHGHKHRVELSPEGDANHGINGGRSVFKDYGHGQQVVEMRPSKKSRRDKHIMYDNGNQENCWGDAAEDWDAEAKGREDNTEPEERPKPEPVSYQARHGRYEPVEMPKHDVILPPPEPRYPKKYEPVYEVEDRLQSDANLYEPPYYPRKPEPKQYRVGQQFSQFAGYDSHLGGGNNGNYRAYPPTNSYPRYPRVKEEPMHYWDGNNNVDYKSTPISEKKMHYDCKPGTSASSIKYEPIVHQVILPPPPPPPVVKDLEKEDGECSDSEEETFDEFIGEDPFS